MATHCTDDPCTEEYRTDKKNPAWEAGLRVIVVVACSVFTSAARLCWFIIGFMSALSTSNYGYFSSCPASSGFEVWLQMSNTPSPVKTFFVRSLYNARHVPMLNNCFSNNAIYYLTAAISAEGATNCNNIRHSLEPVFLYLV